MVEPQMGDVAVCGLEPRMVGEAWGVLCKVPDFKSWMYQIVKTHP